MPVGSMSTRDAVRTGIIGASVIRIPSVGGPGEKSTTLSADLHPGSRTSLLRPSAEGMRMTEAHVPVMIDEVLAVASGTPELPMIDATVGAGGHAGALLAAFPGRELLGIDQDPDAVAMATVRLARFGERARVVHARFDELDGVARAAEIDRNGASFVLFDLGVSSMQVDTPERGFSLRSDAPLDMRMDPTRGSPAADVIDSLTEDELATLFSEHGEARFARRIAHAVVARRPLQTTGELVDAVVSAIPAAARRRGHPATRVFQAIRVTVNDELSILGAAIDDAISLLAPGGRICVLSYHSGEDRIVKDRLRVASTGGCTCPPGLPCVCGATAMVRLLRRGVTRPREDEVARNPRASAARLRAAERLAASEVQS